MAIKPKEKYNSYQEFASEIGAFVDKKNQAYNNSFEKVGKIISIMTEGLTGDQIKKALPAIMFTGRVLDKLTRNIRNEALGGDAMQEDPKIDAIGYLLLDSFNKPPKAPKDD